MTGTTETARDFDGCNRECRKAGKHTMRRGGCEYAPKPEPTVSMSKVYTDPEDGYPSIGFDAYTVPELGELITAGLRASDLPVNGDDLVDVGLVAAHAIVHRHDPDAVPAPATDRAALVDRIRALALLEAADFLRDAHHRDGLSVQEIGTALRHTADTADPMVGSLARDGFGLDEIAAMLDEPVLPASLDRGAEIERLREELDTAKRHLEARRIELLRVNERHRLDHEDAPVGRATVLPAARACRYCPDPACPEDCPECGSPIHDLDAVPAVVAQPDGEA
jgi:hypothetical protein